MPNNMYRRFQVNIFPATFLHIGSGEQLDPTQYVIQHNTMYVLHQSKFISRLLQKDPVGLNRALDLKKQSLGRYWYDHFDPSETDTWLQKYPVDPALQESYIKKLDSVAAQQLVTAFISNPLTGNPIIPGSSIKGAIRTAILYNKMKAGSFSFNKDRDGKPLNVEPTVFRYMGNYNPDVTLDPFKYLKVADTEVSSQNLVLRTVENLKKSENEIRKHNPAELAFLCQALSKGTKDISTTINLHKKWNITADITELIAMCKTFFKDKLIEDREYFLKRNKHLYDFLVDASAKLPENSCFIRLGRGTGCIHKSVNPQKPQTRSLIGKMSMGICQLTFKELA